MNNDNRGRMIAGAILILLGIAFFAMNLLGGLGMAVIIFGVGAAFLVAYFATRTYGFLIPGCILIGVGLGQLGGGSIFSFGGFNSLALGVGFIAIFVIDWLYTRAVRWWPLIPGGVLVVSALAQASQTFQVLLSQGWPLILIIIGLIILAGTFGLTGRRER